jgi:WD40 repeat protein
MFTLRAHTQAVSGIQSTGDGNVAYTCSWDHSLKRWDMERQDCVATFAGQCEETDKLNVVFICIYACIYACINMAMCMIMVMSV